MRPRMRARRGFALVAAIWLMVAISSVALEIALVARDHRLAAANTLEGARARAAAESGIEHARARLARALAEGGNRRTWNDVQATVDPWHDLNGLMPDSVTLDDAAYRVTLTDLGTRLNVNKAVEADLRRLFVGERIDAALADALAQTIMDWRDPDDFCRARGAEKDDYIKAGLAELPRNAPFESMEELLDVRGMSPAIFARIRGDLTLLGSGQINVNAAPRAVLMSLPGMTDLGAQIIARAQQSRRRITNMQELLDLLPSEARAPLEREMTTLLQRVTFVTNEVLIESEGHALESPSRIRMEAVIARGGSSAFVVWRQER